MYIFDTFTNFLSGLGMPGRDKLTSTSYVSTVWTRDQLENSYRSDWIARKAISIPAHDATREWRSWQAKGDQIEKLEKTEQRLGLQLKLQQALVKARLYGGCCILIGVDGKMEKELDPETIKKDGLKFIHVFAPHQLTIDELEKDISNPYYGQPLFYRLQDETGKFGDAKIHPSRMVRLIGNDPPDPMQNHGWGDPLMQMISDAVNAAGVVSQSVATLIAEAKLDVIKIPGLTEIFSTTAGTNRLLKRFSEANVAKSVINGIVMDAEEEWERVGVNFQGMPEILQMYLQIAAGAADIPVTRFLGMSPAGLNSTGESDLVNYYDKIASDQELRLTPALEKLDKAIQRSALGKFDEDIFYEWRPLWQQSAAERATIQKQKADSAKVDADSGLIPFEALVQGRCNQLIEDGTYPGLEAALEDAIENQELLAAQVEEQRPAAANENEEGMDGPLEEEEDANAPAPFGDTFDEHKHPRDKLGKWALARSDPDARTIKPKPGEEVPLPKKFADNIQKLAREVAVEFDYDPELVTVDRTATTYNMGTDKNEAAAICELATGKITLYPKNTFTGIDSLKTSVRGTMVHEIAHTQYQTVRNAIRDERRANTDNPSLPTPLWDKFKEHNAGAVLQARRKGDGVTPYSAQFWKAFEANTDKKQDVPMFLLAEHETVAEMARIKDRTGKLKGTPEWVTFYNDVMDAYAKLKPKRVRDAFDEDEHPRGQPENAGQFVEKGGSSSEKSESEGEGKKPAVKLEPKAIEVGGDQWNKNLAVKLETDYQTAKPRLEKLLDEYEEWGAPTEEERSGDDEDEGPSAPEEWDVLSDDTQQQIENEYKSKQLDNYIESEQQSWHDNGGALDEAKGQLAQDGDWLHDTLQAFIEETDDEGFTQTETEFPLTPKELVHALELEYDSDGSGSGDLEFKWADKEIHSALKHAKSDDKQMRFEGIEEQDYSKLLTKDMRAEIEAHVKEKFEKEAENKSSDMDAPDYLAEQAQEYMNEVWDQMGGEEKYNWAKYNTPIINDLVQEYEASGGDAGIGIPEKYDPLNTTSGKDYRKTQGVARNVSIMRAEEIFEERGIEFGRGMNPGKALRRLDRNLWDAWKGSSTSLEGQLLQVATADELGGRLNPETGRGGKVVLQPVAIAMQADKDYKQYGGYAGIKAYVRAKWETTQFLLDKAGVHELELYRGIALDADVINKAQREKANGYDRVPALRVVRNGAASTTVNPDIANGWSSEDTRVVLRAKVPRTAAISVPAYGINIKSEQEVVIAGTAWKAWDAWLKKAPRFSTVPLKH